MSRKEEPVKVTILDDGPHKGTERREHPAFGQISLSRCTGTTKLYGSALDKHESFINLTVRRSSVDHLLGRDWYHAEGRLPLLELKLSPAQFADMITGMNIGGGVPCTLDFVDGKDMPQIPWDQPTESTKIVDAFKQQVAEKVASMSKEVERLRELVNHKKNLNLTDRKEVMDSIDRFARLYTDSAPFMVDSFSEAAEKVVTHAKAEVESFAQRVTIETGVEVLRGRAAETKQLGGENK